MILLDPVRMKWGLCVALFEHSQLFTVIPASGMWWELSSQNADEGMLCHHHPVRSYYHFSHFTDRDAGTRLVSEGPVARQHPGKRSSHPGRRKGSSGDCRWAEHNGLPLSGTLLRTASHLSSLCPSFNSLPFITFF